MPRPSKNQILKKVLSHLNKDQLGHLKEAREDKELSEEVKQKQAHRQLKTDLLRKGMITKAELRPGSKVKKIASSKMGKATGK